MVSTVSARDDAYRERVARLRRYELEWWLTDSRVRDAVADAPTLADELVELARARTVQTIDVHKRPDWSPRRSDLHRAVLAGLAAPTASATPVAAVMTLGLPGSGKSSMLRRIASAWGGRPVDAALDADEVRIALPEYAKGVGSGVVQDETSELTYGPLYGSILDGPAESHPLLIVDTVGDPQYLPATAQRLLDAGWPVAVLLAEIPLAEALDRARSRALDNGRIVDETYLRSRDGVPAAGLAELRSKGLITGGWAAIDTSGPRHQAPKVLDGDGAFGATGAATPYW